MKSNTLKFVKDRIRYLIRTRALGPQQAEIARDALKAIDRATRAKNYAAYFEAIGLLAKIVQERSDDRS